MNKREAEDAIAKIQAAHPNADPRLQGLTLDEICALALNALATPSIPAPVAESELRDGFDELLRTLKAIMGATSVYVGGDGFVLVGDDGTLSRDLGFAATTAIAKAEKLLRLHSTPSMQTDTHPQATEGEK